MTDFNYVKLPAAGANPRQTAQAVNLLIDGKFNSTAYAAGSMFVSARAKESFTLTHASNSQTDKTFTYIVIG